MRIFILMFAALMLPTTVSADGHESEPGYASFARTTILARYADLEPSITFWRDVMGFSYAGDPKPTTGSSSPIGWDAGAVRYFTSFSSKEGSTIALLMIEDDPDFPAVALPESGAAIGGSVLVHTAKNLKGVYDRAVANNVTILKPYTPSVTGRSMQIYLRAPTGQLVEIYEMIPPPE